MAFYASFVPMVNHRDNTVSTVGLAIDAVFEAADDSDAADKLRGAGYTAWMFQRIPEPHLNRLSRTLAKFRSDIEIKKKKGVVTRTYRPHTPKYVA